VLRSAAPRDARQRQPPVTSPQPFRPTRDSKPDPAYVGAILTTTATAAQVYAWYAHWLNAHGYHQVAYYRMSDQTSGVAWRAPGGREQVQIGVFDAAELAAQRTSAWRRTDRKNATACDGDLYATALLDQ
jgi:hypothetical protein